MAKKRLSDLLREEVNKSAEEAEDQAGRSAEPSSEASAESSKQSSPPASKSKSSSSGTSAASSGRSAATSKSKAASASTSDSNTKSEPEKSEMPKGEPLRLGVHPSQQNSETAAQSPTPSAPAVSSDAKADAKVDAKVTQMETTIADLKTQLETAQQQSQQQEAQIEQQTQQIEQLQAETKQQQSVIEQLQAEVKQSQSLKTELEEARQVILKLSEINAKPVDAKYANQPATQATSQTSNGAAPLHYVKAGESKPIDPPAARSTTSRSGAPLVPAPSNAAEPELESKPVQFKLPEQEAGKLAPAARHQQELRRILDHPVRPGSLPPMSTPSKDDKKEDKKLSETDMGWVD